MDTLPVNVKMIRRPSAVIPVAMSLAALIMVVIHFVLIGPDRSADEGTAAHVFQILLVGQIPVVAYFAFKWLPRLPRQSARILALQAVTWIVAVASAYWLT